MHLGDEKFDDYVIKIVSLGAMPRISHMVVVNDKKDLSDKLLKKMKDAYQ